METTFTASATRLATRMFVLALPMALHGCATAPPPEPVVAAAPRPPTEMITPQLIATEQEKSEGAVSKDLSRLLVQRPPSYTIDSGDILSIVVWDHPELVGATVKTASGAAELTVAGAPVSGFMIDPKGQLQFPFAGTLKIAGMTEDQARRVLEKKLARYIVTPKVALQVHAYRSKQVYVDGAVGAPGIQAINNVPMTLMEALNRAGGLLPTADQSRMVLERGKQRYRIDMGELVQKRINPRNLLLASGDVVRVHARDDDLVVVSGEVVVPRALAMRDGRLTLNEALGEAGGLSPQPSEARQVYVVRKTKDGVRLFQLDVRSADAMAMAQEFELRPKDVVHVATTPPANWNGKLLPSKQVTMTAAVTHTSKP
ncbi:MAG: polysaccharide biosynthesis/export family protein [Pseudomonadota bacterium]|nr:polysaccharide biosynthesis/export family protein [Pseudomonadota bacterium]